MEVAMSINQTDKILTYQNFETIANRSCKPCYVPISCKISPSDAEPATVYANLSPNQSFLLESMEGVPRRAVRSIIGINPISIISLSESPIITGKEKKLFDSLIKKKEKNPLIILDSIIKGINGDSGSELAYSGGLTGYCRYDLIDEITDGMTHSRKSPGPVMRFMIPGEIIVFDHIGNTITIISGRIVHEGDDLKALYDDAVSGIKNLRDKISKIKPISNINQIKPKGIKEKLPDNDRRNYEQSVEKALEHIKAGDIFQVVISRQVKIPYSGDPFKIYRILREINPSPYLYYLNFGDETVVGSSPEMLVKAEDETITTVPIAGTRPRGRDQNEDEKFGEDLKSDPKEKAEHLMLVDLARNDIGKVSGYGTVKVSNFMDLEKFSHVQHLTSVVTGEVKPGVSRVDILKACFPAGTVSGAPKIRAMQIISDLEPCPRDLYAGAVGYFDFNGLMEFAITIRTVVVKENIATIQVGAGIVADSIPSNEFEETQVKAQAIAGAVYAAGEET